jgi:hypothetical protein
MAKVSSKQSTRKPPVWYLLAAAALCLLILGAYSNLLGARFVLDNKGLLLLKPRIRAASADLAGRSKDIAVNNLGCRP